MFLSNTAKYGIIAIVDIAINSNMNTHIKISELSKRTNISLKYLEVILLRLKNANILHSITGPNGGYTLAKDKNKITLCEIIFAADKKIKITRCNENESSCLKKNSRCIMHHFFNNIQNFLNNEFSNISIDALIDQYHLTGRISSFFQHQIHKQHINKTNDIQNAIDSINIMHEIKNTKQESKNTKDKGYIYADYNATFPMRDEFKNIHLDAKSDVDMFFNPSSIHRGGQKARKIIEDSRNNIKASIGIEENNKEYEIIFTSTATEANNIVIYSFKDTNIVISAIEHPSIYQIYPNMHIINVDINGLLNIKHLEDICSSIQSNNNENNNNNNVGHNNRNCKNHFLCSVVFANNETGIIQPIKEIANIVHKYNGLIHVDAVQIYGRHNIDIKDLSIDIMTISGHKVGAGFGAACLIYKNNHSMIEIKPLIHGGGQEKGIRCGTENVQSIYYLGKFANNINYYIQEWCQVEKLRNIFEEEIHKISPEIIICSRHQNRIQNTSCIITPSIDNDTTIMFFDMHNIYLSKGSACSSGTTKASHVLLNMGYTEALIKCSIRVSFGPYNTIDDIMHIANLWRKLYNQLVLR